MREFDHSFFQNINCKYFPCHKTEDKENFNCLFCFCPLYALGEHCGGNFKYNQKGIKDCINCLVPHEKNGYHYVISKYPLLMEMTKQKTDT